MYVRWFLILITFAFEVYTQNASEQVILPGKEYMAGTRIQNAWRGVSFIIPRDWKGAMPPDQGAFLMNSDRKAGIGIAIFQSEVSEPAIVSYLKQPQNLGDNIILKPVDEPRIDGSKIYMNYNSVNGKGRALAISGPYQNTVMFLYAGPSADTSYFQNLLEKLGSSVVFSHPDPARLGKAWERALSGKMLKKVSADDSDSSFPAVSHLCPGRAGHYTLQANLETGDDNPTPVGGTWKIETSGTEAFLVVYPSGQKPVKVSLDNFGNVVILQGRRYFLTASALCK